MDEDEVYMYNAENVGIMMYGRPDPSSLPRPLPEYETQQSKKLFRQQIIKEIKK